MKLPVQVSDAVKKLNPTLWPDPSLARVQAQIAEPHGIAPLVRKISRAPSRRQRLAGRRKPVLRVGLVAVVNRVFDSDNQVAAAKPLRDAVSEYFQLDDADDQIEWHYQQIVWPGKQGTVVIMEMI